MGYGPWDNLVGGVDQRTAAASTDEVAEVANKLAQVSLHDQEYLVVDAETLDAQAADREEVTKDLEEGNCELPTLTGAPPRSRGARTESETEGVRLDQPTVMSLQTGDSDEEEAAPDWGPTLNLRASPRAWSSSFAPTYDLQGATSSERDTVVLKEGPGTGPATEASERSPEERSVVRETTQQRERARASSEPPRQAEEEPAEGRKESRAPSAHPPTRGRRKIVFGSSKRRWLRQTTPTGPTFPKRFWKPTRAAQRKPRRLSASGSSPRAAGLVGRGSRKQRGRRELAWHKLLRKKSSTAPGSRRSSNASNEPTPSARDKANRLTNNRLQADIEAGVPVWVARRRHRARERAAKHQAEQAKVGAPPLNSAGSEQRNPGEGGKGLDEDLDAAAKRELREFRRTLLQQEGGTQSLRRQPESQARKKRRREERKAKAKAEAPGIAASSLAVAAIASLPSGADALSSLPTLPGNLGTSLTSATGVLLLCCLGALLTVGAAARFAPGPTTGERLHNGT